MHIEQAEIYSDTTNRAVLRHPARRFPGVLIQGDNLNALCAAVDDVCTKAKEQLDSETFSELVKVHESLRAYLTHYKVVLGEHGISLPFSGVPHWLR